MDEVSIIEMQQTPKRIGILLADMGVFNFNKSVLKYLVLHLNTLQKTFEFEFLPYRFNEGILEAGERLHREGKLRREEILQEDEFTYLKNFIQMFSDKAIVPHDRTTNSGKELRNEIIPNFLQYYQKYLRQSILGFKIKQKEIPERLILVTTARFDNNFYSLREKGLAILALGGWDHDLAPPSLIEYILTLILRQSVAMVSQSLGGSVHFGAKGCLCDFSQSLNDVRLNVLNGFICSYCREALEHDCLVSLADELELVMKKDWLGNVAEPHAPARLAANMGYNLFITKGFILTPWEKVKSILTEEVMKQFIANLGAIITGVLVAYLLFRFGLK